MTQQRTKSDISPDRVANGDIVERLRKWFHDVNAVSAIDVMDEAANEIERLRQSDRPQPIKPAEDTHATHATPCEGSVQGEGALTDEEREAVYRAEARLRTAYVPDDATAATLRKLLERMP
jgi:hypothetical protein